MMPTRVQKAKEAMRERLDHEINSFNGWADKYYHVMKLRMNQKDQLVMGTDSQFNYGVHQAVLAEGVEAALTAAVTLRMYHCAEFGE